MSKSKEIFTLIRQEEIQQDHPPWDGKKPVSIKKIYRENNLENSNKFCKFNFCI